MVATFTRTCNMSETPDSGRPVRESRAEWPKSEQVLQQQPDVAGPEALCATRRITVIERRSAPLVTYSSSASLPPSTPPSRARGSRSVAVDSEGSSDAEDSPHQLNEKLAGYLDKARVHSSVRALRVLYESAFSLVRTQSHSPQLRLLEAQNRVLSTAGERCSSDTLQMRALCERELSKLRANLQEAEERRAALQARASTLEERLAEANGLYEISAL